MALTTSYPFHCPTAQGQHYEEEKRAMNHEIVALNSHLLEAKVTIDKLSEDNVSAIFVWPLEGCRRFFFLGGGSQGKPWQAGPF